MKSHHGMSNPNYRHGNRCGVYRTDDVQTVMLQNRLRRILTADCTRNQPEREEMAWAMEVIRQRPAWAREVLKAQGIE